MREKKKEEKDIQCVQYSIVQHNDIAHIQS